MPTDDGAQVVPDTARVYTKTLVDLYGTATAQILRLIAARLNAGAEAGPLRVKAADLLALRAEAQAVAADVAGKTDRTLTAVVGAAYDHGTEQGSVNLAAALGYVDAPDRPSLAAVQSTKASTVHGLAKGLAGTLRHLPIVRAAEDAYRQAVADTIAPAAAGVETRRQAAQRALDRLAMRGVGGFVDQSGRRWQLASYVEMATRTTLAQAATEGSVDRITQTTPFVQVSDQADECPLCRPWEGKVLVAGTVPEKWADVETDGPLSDARSAGLFHPGCTHALSAFIPGLTRRRQGRSGAQGNADRQEQRRLERGLRAWKQRQAVAITPEAKRLAAAKVKEWSARIDAHVTATNRHRLRARESITRAR